MPTTVHIPADLLDRVDERAEALRMSRNRYVVRALRRAVAEETAWSPAFLETLDALEPLEGVDELHRAILASRASARPLP